MRCSSAEHPCLLDVVCFAANRESAEAESPRASPRVRRAISAEPGKVSMVALSPATQRGVVDRWSWRYVAARPWTGSVTLAPGGTVASEEQDPLALRIAARGLGELS